MRVATVMSAGMTHKNVTLDQGLVSTGAVLDHGRAAVIISTV